MKFNEKLIELRKKQGLSQEELGYKLNVTRQTVSKWELGQTTPEMDKLSEMSKIFNISVDDLINETEITSTKNIEIEDQTIGTERTREGKIKLIIIAVIVIIFVYMLIKMFAGFTLFNKVTDADGIFGKFFTMFNKVSDSQQNMFEDVDGFISDAKNLVGNSFDTIDTKKFNNSLELYKGNNSELTLKSLLDEVITINKKEQRKITVKYMETETQDTDEIKNIKKKIANGSDFEVEFEYDDEGFIFEVSIERVYSQFEINRFNNSYEMYAGSTSGSFVISVLDKIITNNKTNERKITVQNLETETQKEDEIKSIKYTIEKFEDYEITFEYDENGFIYKAIVEKI